MSKKDRIDIEKVREKWTTLEDLKESLENFTKERGLHFSFSEEHRKASISKKAGRINFREDCHIAIYEDYLFSSNRVAFVISIDNCKDEIRNCDLIGDSGLLIGSVVSRPKGCVNKVWNELKKLVEKACEKM